MAVITVSTQMPEDPALALTYYQQVVNEFMVVFDKMVEILPMMEEMETVSAETGRRNLNVPGAFFGTVITAVEQVPELNSTRKFNVEKNRKRLQFLEAFRPLADKVASFSMRLNRLLRATQSTVATESLQVYRVAQSHIKDGKSPIMEAHVFAMKRDLGRKSNTKAEREARKAQKLREVLENELLRLGIDRALVEKLEKKEVKLLAA